MQHTRVFIHGLESTSQGTKGLYFRERFPEMIIEDYEGPLEQRMLKLEKTLSGLNNLILVGSSFGGLMAALYGCTYPERVLRLILLAPALNLPDFQPCLSKTVEMPVFVYHGAADDVVPPLVVKGICTKVFINLKHHLVEDDHSLHMTFHSMNWNELLEV
jgi:pimeloyl-ACP methyl ester carboxylesterase